MTPDGNDASRRRRGTRGAHRTPRKGSALTRTVAVGSAAACLGVAAFDVATPTASAISIVLPSRDGSGNVGAVQINIFEGNVLNFQFGLGRSNVSNNSILGNSLIGYGNDVFTRLALGNQSRPIEIGATAGSGNATQINIFSFNIINPQVAFGGGNVSNNTTLNNVAAHNGNNSRTEATSGGGAWFGTLNGNGNAVQLAFGSGNVFNPQVAFGGENISNNVAVTNLSVGNGNGSETETSIAGAGSAVLGGLTGNGNTFQAAALSSNIFNPQFSSGNGNTSNNTATTNDATGNGNSSASGSTTAGGYGGVSFGSTGNGNTTQTAAGSSNIFNNQSNFGISTVRPPSGTAARTQNPAVRTGGSVNNDAAAPASSSAAIRGRAAVTNSISIASGSQQQGSRPATGAADGPGQTRAAGAEGTAARSQAPRSSASDDGSDGHRGDAGSVGSSPGSDD